jgi:hypothetical protein
MNDNDNDNDNALMKGTPEIGWKMCGICGNWQKKSAEFTKP